MWGKVLGALFGLALLKLPGLLLGILIGHWFDRAMRQQFERNGGFNALFGDKQDEQALFRYTTFATMGHIAKARGSVTTAHINQASDYMAQLGLTEQQQKEAQAAFRDGKAVNFPLQPQLERFYQAYRRRKDVLHLFLEIQINIACAQASMSAEQYRLLQQVAAQLNFNSAQLDALIQSQQAHSRFSGRKTTSEARSSLADAYKVLDIEHTASDVVVKKAYRKLMALHHPDKLMAQGVPAEMLDMAKRRTQDIQAAYELIRRQRKQNNL